MKRIAFFGDGTLDLEGTRRDGSIGDRRDLFLGLKQLGVEPLYLSPRRYTVNGMADHVVGWEWRDRIDALVVEARWSLYPPKDEDDRLRKVFFQQAALLRDWHRGLFGAGVPLFIVDFDLNVRPVFGLGGRGSLYVQGKDWPEATPWMPEVLDRISREATILAPYDPARSPLETKRQPGHTYRVVRWLWPYPGHLESPPRPWAERSWELSYPGSDYNRREKFYRFYVAGAQQGCNVAVTGVWQNMRKGKEKGWDRTGFRTEVEEAGRGRLRFLASGQKQLAYQDVYALLGATKVVVQIVPDTSEKPYERLGYYTIRPAEAAAAGALPFVDRDIQAHEDIVPDEWFRVSSFDELRDKMRSIRGRELDYVDWWRAHLRSLGTGVDRARDLMGLISDRPTL